MNGRLAIVGLLLAATASAIFVGSELLRRSDELSLVPPPTVLPDSSAAPSSLPDTLARHPAPLQPTVAVEATGRRMLSLAGPSALVATVDGGAWTLGSGRLVRVDADGEVRDWTLVDDAAFGVASGLAWSRFGGVWMFGASHLRLFDGSAFRDVVDASAVTTAYASIGDAVEGPDGRLWVTTEAGVFRWDGSTWTAIPWSLEAFPGEIGFDNDGRSWVSLWRYPDPYGLGVASYDGAAWTEYAPEDVPLHGQGSHGDTTGYFESNLTRSLAPSADGSVWFGTDGGLVHFDGTAWTEERPFGQTAWAVSSISVGPDGTVWAVHSGSGARPRIARLAGPAWQEVDPPAGIEDFGGWALVAATGDGAVFASDAGLYRLSGEAWSRAWPASQPAGPGMVSALAAVSSREVLAGSGDWDGGPAGVWRYEAGTWERDTSDGAPAWSVRSLAFAADGALWAGGEGGVSVRRDGAWTSVTAGHAWQVIPAADGTIWVALGVAGVNQLRPDGPTWRREVIAGAPLENVQSVAVTSDGTIWIGSVFGLVGKGGLARFDGRTWSVELPLGRPLPEGESLRVDDLLAASDGSLWVAGEEWGSDAVTETPPAFFVARFRDGEWTVYDMGGGPVSALAEQADGSILAVGRGIWTFAGGRRTQQLDGQGFDQLSVAADGSVWVAGRDIYCIR